MMQKRMSGIHMEKIVQVSNRCSEDAGSVRRFALVKLVDPNPLPSPRLSCT